MLACMRGPAFAPAAGKQAGFDNAMYVVSWHMLKQCLSARVDASDPDAPVGLPGAVLRLLIESALTNQPFDERSYLLANPDVAEAMKQGKCASGRAHYLATGYFEGRDTGAAGFDHAWYLQRYPDVALAVQSGKAGSALQHYRQSGAREWRSPNRVAEADIARWRGAIGPLDASAKQLQPGPHALPKRGAATQSLARE